MVLLAMPRAEGVVTAVHADSESKTAGLVIVYEFLVGDDGPYTGESAWFGDTVYINELVGRKTKIRYRKDDPSVNRLDDPTEL